MTEPSHPHDVLRLSPREGWLRFEVRAKPRAPRSSLGGVREGALVVALAAPPVDGEANEALISLLAAQLGVRRQSVRLVLGAASKRKLVEVDGLSPIALSKRLGVSAEVAP